jgi:2-haloacid dehalogenase
LSRFTRIFGDARAMREWFNLVILYSEAATLSGAYATFGELGGAVLTMLAAIKRVSVQPDDLVKIKDAVAAMPPHADVVPGLGKLHAAGFRMVTLTNNPREVCNEQLKHAGIRHYFEQLFSIVDGARRYKPAPEAYRSVAESLRVTTSELCLVACHTWDTMGAAAAGLDDGASHA